MNDDNSYMHSKDGSFMNSQYERQSVTELESWFHNIVNNRDSEKPDYTVFNMQQ